MVPAPLNALAESEPSPEGGHQCGTALQRSRHLATPGRVAALSHRTTSLPTPSSRRLRLDSLPVPGETGLCVGVRASCRAHLRRVWHNRRHGGCNPRDRTLFAEPAAI